MAERNIQQRNNELQVTSALNFEVTRFNGKPMAANGHVFCPMCEDWHENNTWCQAPSMDGGVE